LRPSRARATLAVGPFFRGIDMNRRELVTGLAAMPWMASVAGAAAPPPGTGTTAAPLKFATPEDELRAFIRMKGALEPVDVPLWYFGTLYAQMPDGTSSPLLGFQGLEYARFEQRPDGAYRMLETMTTCFTDPVTGEFIDEFRNPITGKVNRVVSNMGSAESYEFATTHAQPLFGKYTRPNTGLGTTWAVTPTHAWMSYRRTYPDVWPKPSSEYITFHAPREAVDGGSGFVPATFFSTTVLPWFKWLEMGDRPGWTLWHANGYKFRTLDEMPRALIARLEQKHPQALVTPPRRPPAG
jgi:hypothetical protein